MRYLLRLYKTHQIVGHFLIIHTALNVLEAFFMPLTPLEAYIADPTAHFWQLGYIDQAPIIHWWVYIGQYCVGNYVKIGIRLLSIIGGFISILIIWHLIPTNHKKRKQLAFVAIITTVLPLHFFSFLSLEGSPLLLFTGIFLWAIYRFQKHTHYLNACLLGIATALLLYTQYESILLITLSFLVFYHFFKKKSFYVTLLTALILLSPHLWWLHTHQYISLQKAYAHYTQWTTPTAPLLNILWETLKNQFLYAGFLLPLIYIYLWTTPSPKDRFSLLLKIILPLYLLLYSVLSIYTEIPFWQVGSILSYALIIMTYQHYLLDKRWQNAITANFLIAFIFMISFRVAYAKNDFALFGNTKRIVQHLKFLMDLSDNTPIALINNAYKISVAHFYLPESAFFSIHTEKGNERTSYRHYTRYINQPVILVSENRFPEADTFVYDQKLFFYVRVPSFQYKGAATILPENEKQYRLSHQGNFINAYINAPYRLSGFITKDSVLLCTLNNHSHNTQTLPASYQVIKKINHADYVRYKIKIACKALLDLPLKNATLSLNFEQNGIPYCNSTAYPLQVTP